MSDHAHGRKSGRRPIALQVRLAFADLDEFVDRYATNLSDGGIFIRSRDPRPVGSRLSFELRLRGGETVFSGEGVVRWVQGLDSRGLGTPGMGIQFDQLDARSREVLDRILELREAEESPSVVEGALPSSWRPLEEFPPPPEPEPEPEELEPRPPPVMAPGETARTPRDDGFALPAGLQSVIESTRGNVGRPGRSDPPAGATEPPTDPPAVTTPAPPPPAPSSAALTADLLASGLDRAEPTPAPPASRAIEPQILVSAPSSVVEASERTAPMFGVRARDVVDGPPSLPKPGASAQVIPVMTPTSSPVVPSVPPPGRSPPVMVPSTPPPTQGLARIGLVQQLQGASDTSRKGAVRIGGTPSLAIGIDVGWSSLRVGGLSLQSGEPRRIPVGPASNGVPAIVAFDGQRVLTGAAALAHAKDEGWGLRGVLRLVGARPDSKIVQLWQRRQMLEVGAADDGTVALPLGRELVPASVLARRLFEEVRTQTEDVTNSAVTHAALAVPPWLPIHQRRALRAAAEAAGLKVTRMMPAPVAAYAGLHSEAGKRRSLIVDWGDGGLAAAVVEQSQNVVELASVTGDPELGLVEVDLALLGQLLGQFEKDTGLAVPEDLRIFERVMGAAAEARTALQDVLEYEVSLPNLVPAGLSKADLETKLTRARFSSIAQPFVDRAYEIVRQSLADRRFGGADLDEVVMLGGMWRSGMLARRLAEKLFKEPTRPGEPRDVAALGAARLSDGERSIGKFVVGGVAGFSLNVLSGGQLRRVIERTQLLPVERTHVQPVPDGTTNELVLPLYQGDKPTLADCEKVGVIRVGKLPSGSRQDLRVAVTLTLTEGGELKVRAKDANNNRELEARLDEPTSGDR